MSEAIMDYDPNLTNCGQLVKQTVRLTFGAWEYRKALEVIVGGNCRGFDVIEAAVGIALDGLYGDEDYASIVLTNAAGDNLICEDDEGEEEDWLKNMLIGAEIISIEPQAKHPASKEGK